MSAQPALAAEGPTPFLGVTQSACGRVWAERLSGRGEALATAISQRYDLPEILARVIAGRGIEPADVEAFLDPALRRAMPDPARLTDMETAAARIADAAMRREQVAIFGDYDVDGATSSAVLARFLRHCGLDPLIHIPDRIFEGYGPNVDAVRALAARGATLLVTVDCGSTSVEPLLAARAAGMDVIVIDHHQPGLEPPPALAFVNPNRVDDLSGLGHLAAVGLAFMTLVAVNRELRRRGFWQTHGSEPDLLTLLDLVALGTVADVVPLRGLNRAFVAKGLLALRRRENLGLTALADVAGCNGPPEPWHLGFVLGPRINAGGRIGRADLGATLLLEDDPSGAARIAADLDALNRERQAMEQAAVAEAEAQALGPAGDADGVCVVTASEGWHPGIVGLIAARLKERFGKPAFAIALDAEGGGTGSGRSISGVDLGRCVRDALAAGLLRKGGGHAMAAGVTLAPGMLPAFRSFLAQRLGEEVATARATDALLIDGVVSAAGVHADLFAALNRAAPFGAGNPEPLLALPRHTIVHVETMNGGHLRTRLRAGDGATVGAVAFRAADRPLGEMLKTSLGQPLHIAGALSCDRRRGEERIEVRIVDAARPSGATGTMPPR